MGHDLLRRGYSVHPNFVDSHCAAALAKEASFSWERGDFERPVIVDFHEYPQYSFPGLTLPAVTEVRRGSDTSIRGDHVLWLDEPELKATPSQRGYLDKLEVLRQAINNQTRLDLFVWEGHLAIYPPDSFYRRHIDAAPDYLS